MSDLEWIEQVELYLALADNESKFENALDKTLPKLLTKLPIQQEAVLGVLKHINKRLISQNVNLPVKDLSLLFSESTGMVSNFVLIYLEMGIPRLPVTQVFPLLNALLSNWHQKSLNQKQKLFHLTLPILIQFKAIPLDDVSQMPLFSNDADWTFLLDCLMKVFMYSVPPNHKSDSFKPQFSPKVTNFITNDDKVVWASNAQELVQVKLKILEFLSSEFLSTNAFLLKRFVFFLWASCDTYHELSYAGENGLKKFMKPDFEEKLHVQVLYDLYQGNPNVDLDSEFYRAPAPLAVKIAILTHFLTKSASSANMFPNFLQVSFDALFGVEDSIKLKMAGISFVLWILRMSKDESLNPVAPVFLSGLVKLVTSPDTTLTLKGSCYEALSSLCSRVPTLFTEDLNFLKSLFDALEKQHSSIKYAIQGTILSVAIAFKSKGMLDEDVKSKLTPFLTSLIAKQDHHCRYSALKFANTVVGFDNHFMRYLCLLVSDDLRLDIRDEAFQGLEFPTRHFEGLDDSQIEIQAMEWRKTIPDLEKMTGYILFIYDQTRMNGFVYPSSKAFSHILIFLRQLLIYTVNPTVDRQGLSSFIDLENLNTLDYNSRRRLQDYMTGHSDLQLIRLLEMILSGSEFDPITVSIATQMLSELLCLGNTRILTEFSTKPKLDLLMKLLGSVKPQTRLSCAHLLGILMTQESLVHEFNTVLKNLYSVIESSDVRGGHSMERRDGVYLVIGYLIGRLYYRYKDTWKEKGIVDESLVYRGFHLLEQGLGIDSREAERTCCLALAEACRYSSGDLNVSKQELVWSLESTLDKMILIAKTTNDAKLQETVVYALGQLCIGKPHLTIKVTDFIYSFSSTKNLEIYFTLGEVLCCLAFGYDSSLMEIYLDIPSVPFLLATPAEEKADSNSILLKTLEFTKPDQSPALKRASSVWLLCMVKYAGKSKLILNHLVQIHSSFSLLLSDRDDFIQDVASKGIGLLYDLGDAKMKEELVLSLIQVFSEGRKLVPQSVTSDTVLFDTSSSLGNSPDGGAINTYQSVLSLAADLNQPDLVYRFMSLASHHAIWNSKKGASLGFSSIAIQAKHQLAPHLPKIIPKLYRYQFDPSPQVSKSMKEIWQTLIPESNKVLSEYFTIIIQDLLIHIVDRQWRVREASCNAIADLIHARQLSDVEPFLSELWNLCFRALDDIKESVRVAGLNACKTLTHFTLKYVDVDNVNHREGRQVLQIVIPFFLSKGLSSVSEDIKLFSLQTILKICDKSGSLLKPFVSDMISLLLEGLSNFEPQVMNYLSFHVDKYNMTQQQLESSRLSATKTSPMMAAIDKCIDQVDETILADLVPRLCTIIRKGIGLPTKAGVNRVVCTLCLRFPTNMEPYGSSLLKALSGAIQDRSLVLKKVAATAIAHVSRVCPIDSLISFVQFSSKFYLESQNEDEKQITFIAFKELGRYAPDKIKSILGQVLPLTFLGLHDPIDALKEEWNGVWDELSAGSSSAARLWIPEIMKLCIELNTNTQSWNIKRQVSRSIADLASVSGTSFDFYREQAFKILLENSNGRTWLGKEDVNDSIMKLTCSSKEWVLVNSPLQQSILETMMRESRKKNRLYKRVAIENLGKVVEALQANVYSLVKDDLISLAKGITVNEDDMDEDDPREKPLLNTLRANAFTTLGHTFVYGTRSKEEWETLLSLFCNELVINPWNIRLAIIESLETILSAASNLQSMVSVSLLFQLLKKLLESLADVKYAVLTEATIRVLKLLKPIYPNLHQYDSNEWVNVLDLVKKLSLGDVDLFASTMP